MLAVEACKRGPAAMAEHCPWLTALKFTWMTASTCNFTLCTTGLLVPIGTLLASCIAVHPCAPGKESKPCRHWGRELFGDEPPPATPRLGRSLEHGQVEAEFCSVWYWRRPRSLDMYPLSRG